MSRLLFLVLVLFVPAVGVTSPSIAVAAEVVHYQCKDWKAKHIHDAKKAETIAKTMKNLKVEVSQSQHNGHIDLKYRCVKERSLSVKSHKEALDWEKWFKEYGFKAYHTH